MNSENTNASEAVINLLVGAVPERRMELGSLWERYNPRVEVVSDRRQITLNATKTRIRFDSKTMDVFWLLGFNGWRSFECYSPHIVVSRSFGASVADTIYDDDGLPKIERDYRERRATAWSLIDATSADQVTWPPDIPRPSADRSACASSEYKAAFDLTLSAVASLLLHEFRHVMLDADNQRHRDRREEEMACDVWARQFMTEKIEDYAEQHNHSFSDVLRKRSMALGLAAVMIHDITPAMARCGMGEYFSVGDRARAFVSNTPLTSDDPFWTFVSSLLIGVHRANHIPIDVGPMSPRALTDELLATL